MKKERGLVYFIKVKKLKFILPIAIIIIGICVIAFPWYKAWWFDNMQNKAMGIWREAILNGEVFPYSESASSGQWSTATVVLDGMANENSIWEENTDPRFSVDYLINNIEGIITIERINLKAAILKDITRQNIDISICSVDSTRAMGQIGNYLLAGHNSQIYGRHFSRLIELNIGDIIMVENGSDKYEYKVNEIFSVSPSDVWVMNNDIEKRLITLITCDYRTNPMSRLIVKGEMMVVDEQISP